MPIGIGYLGGRQPIDQVLPLVRIPEPQEQLNESRFACTGWADHPDRFVAVDLKAQIVEHTCPGPVAEGDPLEGDGVEGLDAAGPRPFSSRPIPVHRCTRALEIGQRLPHTLLSSLCLLPVGTGTYEQ